MLSRLSPRESSNTTAALSGMTLASAIDSSIMRLPASAARLSLISTISISRSPSWRPVCAARLRKRSLSSVSGPCFRRPTAATTIRIAPLSLSGWPACVLACRRPHLFKIVEGANLWPEDVHDHVACIDQDPVALPHALDTNARIARIFDVLDEVIGNGADMAQPPSSGHNHVVSDRRFFGKFDDDAVLGFHVFKTRKDGAEHLLGSWVPGDVFGRTTRCPRECRCIQGFWSFLYVALTPGSNREPNKT